jgi:sensor c-di-GMP phosphodiesterase-like protein
MAARIGDDTFSLLHEAGAPIDQLIRQLEAITRAADPAGIGLTIDASTLAIDTAMVAEVDLALALTHTLRRFGAASGTDLRTMANNLRSAFQNSVRTVGSIKRAINEQSFTVVFQPIVQINTGRIHHFEALCRFEAGITLHDHSGRRGAWPDRGLRPRDGPQGHRLALHPTA